ncbi:XRE family transcriptional regulator [Actinosynnema pretiosum subsp. pretiosum]
MLRDALTMLGWSAEQLVARVNQARHRRGAPHLHSKTGYHWLRGTRPAADVRADVLTVLSSALRVPVTATALGWDTVRPRKAGRALDNPADARAATLLTEVSRGEPMHRRKFTTLTGAAVTAAVMELLLPGKRLPAAEDGDDITAKLIDAVEKSVREARDLDDSEGSTPSLVWTGGLWRSLATLIRESRYDDDQAGRMHTAFVELSETYGWVLFDAGLHPQAQRVFQTGVSLAKEAARRPDTDRATANLLASASYQASWLGQVDEAGTFLEVAALRAARCPTPRLLAVLADRRITLAGAQPGGDDAVHRATAEAHEHLDGAVPGADPWWSRWLGHTDIDANAGRAWLALDRVDRAEQHLAHHLAPAGEPPRDHALFATDLAHTRLRTGDVTGACEAVNSATASIGQIASPRVHQRLDQAVTALREQHSDHPAVQALTAA